MKPTVVAKRNTSGDFVLMIIQEDLGYDAIEELFEFLKVEYDAQVLQKFDGPYSRRWLLNIDGAQVTVDFDEADGFDLTVDSAEMESLLERIGEDLKARLSES